jgi:hypothetical protein
VASGDEADAWLVPDTDRSCPGPPIELAHVTNLVMTKLEMLHCVGNQGLTLRGWYPALPPDAVEAPVEAERRRAQYGWLACGSIYDILTPEERPWVGDANYLDFVVEPGAGVLMPARGQWITVTGSSDHPAAAACAPRDTDWLVPGRVKFTAVDSGFATPRSYVVVTIELVEDGGSTVHVVWERWGKGVFGKLLVGLIALTRGVAIRRSIQSGPVGIAARDTDGTCGHPRGSAKLQVRSTSRCATTPTGSARSFSDSRIGWRRRRPAHLTHSRGRYSPNRSQVGVSAGGTAPTYRVTVPFSAVHSRVNIAHTESKSVRS